MKKIRKTIAVLLSIFLTAVLFAGCPASNTLKYEGGTLPAGTVGDVYSQNIATATGTGSITYMLKTGSNLPLGLELNDGKIEGMLSVAVKDAVFTVVASAEGFKDAEAQFTLSVFMQYLGGISFTGQEEVAFSDSVATAQGADSITYALKPGSSLPQGLTLSGSGTITGTPSAPVTGVSFTVVASAAGLDSVEAGFLITIADKAAVIPNIIYQTSQLSGGEVGGYYSQSIATAVTAAGGAIPGITYARTGGSLPGGLNVSPGGVITGTPAVKGTFNFTVRASASGYNSASANFTITVVEFEDYTGIGSEYIVSHTKGARVTYVLEAENTNVGGKQGVGYSGPGSLVGVIPSPSGTGALSGTSNDYGINYLYSSGLSINFFVVSDRVVEDAVFTLRLTAEYMNMILTPETFVIRAETVPNYELNDPYHPTAPGSWGNWTSEYLDFYTVQKTGKTTFQNFNTVDPRNNQQIGTGYLIDEWDCTYKDEWDYYDGRDPVEGMGIQINCWDTTEWAVSTIRPWENHVITTRLKLFKGITCISLIVNGGVPLTAPSIHDGSQNPLGTMGSIAPIIDCIGITTKAQIGMYKPEDNSTKTGETACKIDNGTVFKNN